MFAGVNSRSSANQQEAENGTAHPIGEAARLSGFSIDTLPYYERAGLLPEITRDQSGRRRYTAVDLGWLSLIRCLRDTGMPIADIKQFVALTQNGTDTTPQRIAQLESHDRQIDRQVDQLRRDQAYLREKIDFYRRRTDQASQ